jgi:hypothetical protein
MFKILFTTLSTKNIANIKVKCNKRTKACAHKNQKCDQMTGMGRISYPINSTYHEFIIPKAIMVEEIINSS